MSMNLKVELGDGLPWGLRVRELRTKANLTQDELAEKLDTTKATISKIERSVSPPKMAWIEKIAAAFKVEVSELAFGGNQPARTPATMIPIIGMIAAGNWREAVQSPEGFIPVVEPRPHMFALRVQGDSIDLVAPDGAYISIDPTNPTLTDGAMYAVQNGEGDATVKRFRRNPDRLEPVSSNPIHRPIMLGSDPITIIGRATSVVTML